MTTITAGICETCAPTAVNGDTSNLDFHTDHKDRTLNGIDRLTAEHGQFLPVILRGAVVDCTICGDECRPGYITEWEDK